MVISGMSVFIALYNRLRERRYELALLRAMGCSKIRLFQMLIGEGLLLAAIGFAGGVLLSRTGIALLNRAAPDLHFTFRYQWISAEYGLLGATLAVGLLAALIPAWKAYRMDVAAALNASG
jgi:putative ABC transport system permease protein